MTAKRKEREFLADAAEEVKCHNPKAWGGERSREGGRRETRCRGGFGSVEKKSAAKEEREGHVERLKH